MLYLFAGVKRHAEIATFLDQLCQEWSEHEETKVELSVVEVDTQRGGAEHNLLEVKNQATYVEQVEKGLFDMVLSTPPCHTFSRALFAKSGRPTTHPRQAAPAGFPMA